MDRMAMPRTLTVRRSGEAPRTHRAVTVGLPAAEPINVETPFDLLDLPLTPAQGFFVRNNGTCPEGIPLDPDAWTLTIDGHVSDRRSLSVADLKRDFEVASVTTVLECAGNGRALLDPPVEGNHWRYGAVGCARFTGVRLADLLRAMGLLPEAAYTAHHSPDRTAAGKVAISRGLPLWKAMAPETLVAFAMNGEPLSIDHGGPLRIVAPGFPGSAWQKWIARIEVRDREHDGEKMTGTDYRLPPSPLEPGDPVDPETFRVIDDIPVKSLITHPVDGASIRIGEPVEVRGWAWSGRDPVESVAISFDAGVTWQTATLEPGDGPWAWRRFHVRWTRPASGSTTILARATDAAGRSQPIGQAWNPRGYNNNGCHRVRISQM